MSGGDRGERRGATTGIRADQALLGRLAGELAAQEELLEQLLTHLTGRETRIGALKEGLGNCLAGARELRGKVARRRGELGREGSGILGALWARRERLDQLRRALADQQEGALMLAEAIRDSRRLERSQRRELARRPAR